MAAANGQKNIEVFGKVIATLATDAASDVEGIRLLNGKRGRDAVSVYFLPNERITLDMYVSVSAGHTVPDAVAALQENVKSQIESSTKYKVHSVNVQVMTADIPEV